MKRWTDFVLEKNMVRLDLGSDVDFGRLSFTDYGKSTYRKRKDFKRAGQ